MKINQRFLNKAWHRAAIEQTAEEYRQQGFSVQKNKRVGDHIVDLLVRKDDRTIVFEFKSSRWRKEQTERIKALRNYVVHELSGEFRLVWVRRLKEKYIYIDDIEATLYKVCLEESYRDVDQIATHFYLEGVHDIEIDQCKIGHGEIEVQGSGIAEFTFQYGSDSDMRAGDGLSFEEAFPFTFHIGLDHDLIYRQTYELTIDASSFYE